MSFEDNQKDSQNDCIVGRNAVMEALRSGRTVEFLMVAKGSSGVAHIIAECKKRSVVVKEMPGSALDLKLPGVNHQGVALIASSAEYSTLDDIISVAKADDKKALILVLCEIEDPHNLGAIIRTAECAGVHGIVIPKRRSAGLSAAVAKISCGASEYVKVARVSNLVSAVETLKEAGMWVYGADMSGEDVFDTKFDSDTVLVIGNEGRGINRLLLEKCDFLVKIPMNGRINSLNASVAAGVIMYAAAEF